MTTNRVAYIYPRWENRRTKFYVDLWENGEPVREADGPFSEFEAHDLKEEWEENLIKSSDRPKWGSQEWAETYSDDLGESSDY